MAIDWGEGDYELTAEALAPAADALVAIAGIGSGDRVLDVGCGTGNATLAAAARGARVSAADPAERLVAVTRERAAAQGIAVDTAVAGTQLPFPDGAFDAVISSFAVIFSPEPATSLAEMVRVARPGGTVALSTWLPGGAIRAASQILRSLGPPPPDPAPRWDDPEWIAGLLLDGGAGDARVERLTITFEAASPAAWLAEQEDHHPVWLALRRGASEKAWQDVHGRSLRALEEHNEDEDRFVTTSGYAVIRCVRESPLPAG